MPSRLQWIGCLAIVALGVLWVWIFARQPEAVWLTDPNPAVRVTASRKKPFPGDTEVLLRVLRDSDADVRLMAADHLAVPSPDAVRRAVGLVEALKDKHVGVRREAAEALGAVGPEAAPVIYLALNSPDAHVRAGAASALDDVAISGKFAQEPQPEERAAIFQRILDLLHDTDTDVRRVAAGNLTLFYAEPGWTDKAIPAALAALHDKDAEVRDRVVYALGSLASERRGTETAEPVTLALLEALADKNGEVRRSAVRELGQTAPKDKRVRDALLRALRDADDGVSFEASLGLSGMELDAAAVPTLLAAFQDPRRDVSSSVVDVLRHMGDRAKPGLDAALQDPDPKLRAAAAACLRRLKALPR